MSTPATSHGIVRREALRTAALATLLVLAALVVLVVITDVLVARNLTSEIDNRVLDTLNHSLHGPGDGGASSPLAVEPDHDYDEPVLRWYVAPGGVLLSAPDTPALPPSLEGASSPTDATIAGASFRAAGVEVPGGGRLIAAASLAPVSRTLSSLLVAELVVSPLLLVAVFLGALAVGRRVGTPIERMRQQQLAFTADASHELRTPLSVIQAETSLAREAPDSELRDTIDRVGAESQRMRRIVEDLLWLARIDAEPPPPEPEPLDLGELAGAAAERFGAVATTRGLTLRVETPDQAALIRAPREWIDRLCGVLLDNACRYTPAGGTVEIRVERNEQRTRLSVLDTGPGIPDSERERIFDRFHRVTGSGVDGGAGLGLAIASAVVRATDGRWEVGNRPEGGASFSVSWARAGRR